MNKNWTNKFVGLVDHISNWSKDRSSKVCAVIVSDNNAILSVGYNGFARGVDDTKEERYVRPIKYLYAEHAERNAIYNAAAHGISTRGTTMCMKWFPCADCARAIIQSGITTLVCEKPTEEDINGRWGDHFKASLEMFDEVKMNMQYIEKSE